MLSLATNMSSMPQLRKSAAVALMARQLGLYTPACFVISVKVPLPLLRYRAPQVPL